jgi:hypothetical protein
MSGGNVDWRADDAETGAQRIAGRPAQAFWRRLRPCFRGVLMEPHRRAGDGRVSWSWTGPAEPGVPGGADLAGLRRRLGAGLANLAAELERDEEAGGGEAAELHAGMEALVADLTGAPDGRLAAYAARTEAGWMIRSWGVARPGPARRADEADAEPVAKAAEESAAIDTTEKLPTGNATTGRRRLVWVLLIMGALGAAAWGVWGRGAGGQNSKVVEQRETAITAEPVRSAANMGGREPDRGHGPGEAAKGIPQLRAGPATGPVFSAPGAPQRRNGENAATETRLKVVPVPMAYTGPMGTPPETEPKSDGAERDSTRERSSTPAPSGPGATALKPPDGRAEQSSDAVADKKENTVADAPTSDSLASAFKATGLIAGEATERVGEGTPPVEARSARAGEIWDTGPESAARSPEAPAADGPAVVAKRAETVAAKTTTTDAATEAKTSPSLSSRPPALANAPDRAWVCRLGEWRLARTRDVALVTAPAEVSADGDAAAALAAARQQAWERVRAALPSALRRPATLTGWVFLLKAEAVRAGAPVWRMVEGGPRAASTLIASDRAEVGWPEPVTSGAFEARLLGPDGVEWARVRIEERGRRIAVRAGTEVAEAAPWFEVSGRGDRAEDRLSADCVWRSLRPGWAETGWRSESSATATRVVCFGSAATPALPVDGVVALEHPPSGWALAREVRLDPVP